MWRLPYLALFLNLIIIWRMPKRLSKSEIYATWFTVACINFSSDIILALHLKLYEIAQPGIQLWVHVLEWTLGASYGIIYLNFLPTKARSFALYVIAWLVYSVLFEAVLVHVKYIIYDGWKLWYSAVYYFFTLLFLRWHINYIRRNAK